MLKNEIVYFFNKVAFYSLSLFFFFNKYSVFLFHITVENYRQYLSKFLTNLIKKGEFNVSLNFVNLIYFFLKKFKILSIFFLPTAIDSATSVVVVKRIKKKRNIQYVPSLVLSGRRLKLAVKNLILLLRVYKKYRNFIFFELFFLLIKTVVGVGLTFDYLSSVNVKVNELFFYKKPRIFKKTLFLESFLFRNSAGFFYYRFASDIYKKAEMSRRKKFGFKRFTRDFALRKAVQFNKERLFSFKLNLNLNYKKYKKERILRIAMVAIKKLKNCSRKRINNKFLKFHVLGLNIDKEKNSSFKPYLRFGFNKK